MYIYHLHPRSIEKENIKILLMKYSLKKIQAIVKKKKIIIKNRKKNLVGNAL